MISLEGKIESLFYPDKDSQQYQADGLLKNLKMIQARMCAKISDQGHLEK